MLKTKSSHFLFVGIYAIAMAFMESAVVVYMRALYYPEGFIFPLKLIEGRIAVTEVFREVATMIMLITVALIVSKRAIERFAWFIFAFAIWDIFYYIFLVLLLGWPSSLLTWDILFLIPVTWTGPVLAPVINSLTMILLAFVIILNSVIKLDFRVKFSEWVLLISGSLVVIFTYTEGYSRYMLQKFRLTDLFDITPDKEMMDYALNFIPSHFNWILFAVAEVIFFISIYRMIRRGGL